MAGRPPDCLIRSSSSFDICCTIRCGKKAPRLQSVAAAAALSKGDFQIWHPQNFQIFWPLPPCPHLDLICSIKFMQLSYYNRFSMTPLMCGRHIWRLPKPPPSQTNNECALKGKKVPPPSAILRRLLLLLGCCRCDQRFWWCWRRWRWGDFRFLKESNHSCF